MGALPPPYLTQATHERPTYVAKKLLGGNAAAVQRGIRKTDEVPPRYAIPDVIEIVKGPRYLSQELSRLRERYPEVFAKELDRVRERYGGGDANCVPTFTVRIADGTQQLKADRTQPRDRSTRGAPRKRAPPTLRKR